MAHASSRCAEIISSSSHKEQSVPTSKEQSAHTDFGFGSEPVFSGKNAFFLSSSSKDALEFSSTESFLGSSSMNALDFFANLKPPKEGTKNFQSYIGELLEQQLIGELQLTRFIKHLERGELINPISESEALTSTPLLVQRRGLQEYLDKSSLNQKELLGWSRATLEKRARVRMSREETREETRDIYQKLEFHPVKRPVRFEVRDKKDKKRFITLTYPIEVQSTPVTQKQWVEIMGENPSHFVEGEDSVVRAFDGKNINLQPDNPVENVTWWSALEFANRLSEKHGLPPVYDLSDIDWNPGTRPENGTLSPKWLESLDELRIHVKGRSHDPYKGDVYYLAEGYRLPTNAEQIYMLRGGEGSKGSYFKEESEVKEHAWYRDNSGERTHPVGLLQAMMIDGKDFHEIYGNVGEWGWDRWHHHRSKLHGKNYAGPRVGHTHRAKGGGWISDLNHLSPLLLKIMPTSLICPTFLTET